MTERDPNVRYELALLLVALIWGVNFPAVKYALAYIAPLTFNALRFSISVVFLGTIVLIEMRGKVRRAGRRARWLGIVGLGLLGHFAYQVGFVVGLDNSTAGVSAFLISTSPIWTATVGSLTGSERLVSRAWMGLLLAFAGASVLIVGRSGLDLTDATLYGNVVSFLSAIAWGSFTAVSRRFLDDFSPTELAFWTMLAALPFLWAVTLPDPQAFVGIDSLPVWIVLGFSGVLSTGLAYILWNVGIRRVGPAHTAVFANLVPVFAFIIGMLWLGESATILEIGGAVLILTGLFVMRRSRSTQKTPTETTTQPTEA